MLVWDDIVEITEAEAFVGPLTASPLVRERPILPASPRERRPRRSLSIGNQDDFPPPIRRTSTDVTGLPRPVSFSSKFPRINPGASGVAVLEHMERLDAVEAGLKRLGDDMIEEEDEEDDIGEMSSQPPVVASTSLPPIQSSVLIANDEDEGDITGQTPEILARSLPHLEGDSRLCSTYHPSSRRPSVEWHRMGNDPIENREVVVEVGLITLNISCTNGRCTISELKQSMINLYSGAGDKIDKTSACSNREFFESENYE